MNPTKEEFLRQLRIELHKPVKKKFAKRKVRVPHKDHTWSMDLVDMTPWAPHNDGYKWILNVIDVFTRYAWSKPLKSKAAKPVIDAFKEIINESGRKRQIHRVISSGGSFGGNTFRMEAGLGDAVQVSAQVFNEEFAPLDVSSVEVTIKHPATEKEELVELSAVPGKDGHFTGSYAPSALGDFELRPVGAQYKSEDPTSPDTAAASCMVILPDREMGNAKADHTLMRNLSARTRGVFVELDQMLKLADPKLIPPASERIVTQGRPVPLWDNWTTIAIILSLLCLEWILRKRFRMV